MPHSQQPFEAREQARRAIADGDEAGARALLARLLDGQVATELSGPVAEALVATTAGDAEQARRYRATQRKLEAVLRWLDTAVLDGDDLARIQSVVARKLQDQMEREQRRAKPEALPAQSVRLGSGWLEAKLIPKPNGRLNGPYLYFRARRDGRLRSIYLGKVEHPEG